MAPNPLHHTLAMVVGLAALWLVLSGHWGGLLLGLGLASVLLAVWICARMDVQDHEMHPRHLRHLALPAYGAWLAREVVLSAIDVSRRVLSRHMNLSPTVMNLRLSQRTDIARTIYANSITLTPGTVSIDLSNEEVRVHALTRDGAEALAKGEMDRRVSALERRG